jgi:chromate transporter
LALPRPAARIEVAVHALPPPPRAPRAPLREVAAAFLRIGLTSFGGGRALFFYDELVRRRRWLRESAFLEGLALCQLLPGPNIANLAVYLGQRLHGPWGAFVAALGLILPGALLMVVLSALYFSGLRFAGTEDIFRGSGAAAVALVLATVARVAPQGMRARGSWLVAPLVVVCLAILHLDMFLVVPAAAILSVWLNRPRLLR